jgi:hypothetical protein
MQAANPTVYHSSCTISPHHHNILSPYHYVTIAPYHYHHITITIPLYHHITIPLYHHITISPYHSITISLYHHITISPYHSITISLYHHITPSPYHYITILPYHHISTSPYHFITISPYHYIAISLCHHITTSTSHHPTTRSVPLNAISARCQYRNRTPTVPTHRASLPPHQHTSHNLVSLQHNTKQCTAHIGMSGYCDVPWIGQDSSKSKGEGKLVPLNATKTQGAGPSGSTHIWPWQQTEVNFSIMTQLIYGQGNSCQYPLGWAAQPMWKDRTKISADRAGNRNYDASHLEPAA